MPWGSTEMACCGRRAMSDERLYYCSVATGICAAQGILPPDAWSIWFADNP